MAVDVRRWLIIPQLKILPGQVPLEERGAESEEPLGAGADAHRHGWPRCLRKPRLGWNP